MVFVTLEGDAFELSRLLEKDADESMEGLLMPALLL